MLGQSLSGNRARRLAHYGSNDGAEPHASEMTLGFHPEPSDIRALLDLGPMLLPTLLG
jgi:hypothetical protein